ncbi:hypothetical protein BV25DRAFT_1801299, partial [Artomyces pyxidatus]
YAVLAGLLPKYGRSAGAVYQTYSDLVLAQGWSEVEVVDLPSCGRCGFRGVKPEAQAAAWVVPCGLGERLSVEWVTAALRDLGGVEEAYLAIAGEDSSIVYYKLSSGIRKPSV